MANPSGITTTRAATSSAKPNVAGLLEGIGRDVRTIAVDEIELARGKLTDFMRKLVLDASVALIGTFVALIGLAMLCMVVVVALAPVIPALWLRLLLMSLVYLAFGAGATFLYMRRLGAAQTPDLSAPIAELEQTADAVERGLEH
jgi:hypothetical protein